MPVNAAFAGIFIAETGARLPILSIFESCVYFTLALFNNFKKHAKLISNSNRSKGPNGYI